LALFDKMKILVYINFTKIDGMPKKEGGEVRRGK
jgi:hypothetical protein